MFRFVITMLIAWNLTWVTTPARAVVEIHNAGQLMSRSVSPLLVFNNLISDKQAVRLAREKHGGGEVIGVKLKKGNNPVYRVKLLKNGRIKTISVPARR